MGEVHDIERFFEAKLAEVGVKVEPDSALEIIVKLQAEYIRQFQVRWGIRMEMQDINFRPATTADAEKLRQLRETDARIRMFDPRVMGDFVGGRG